MTKKKTTRRAMKQSNEKIISVGYCWLQYLLRTKDADSYCYSQSSGWDCDNYYVGSVVISTGYRPANLPQRK